jgi:hypothetical protein
MKKMDSPHIIKYHDVSTHLLCPRLYCHMFSSSPPKSDLVIFRFLLSFRVPNPALFTSNMCAGLWNQTWSIHRHGWITSFFLAPTCCSISTNSGSIGLVFTLLRKGRPQKGHLFCLCVFLSK